MFILPKCLFQKGLNNLYAHYVKYTHLPLTHCCQHRNIILFTFCHLMGKKTYPIALMHNSLTINEVNISLYLLVICFLSVKCLFISFAHSFYSFFLLVYRKLFNFVYYTCLFSPGLLFIF